MAVVEAFPRELRISNAMTDSDALGGMRPRIDATARVAIDTGRELAVALRCWHNKGLAGLAAFAVAWSTGCQSDHRVSPFPDGFGIESLVQPPDLKRQLERVHKEMDVERMTATEEIRGAFADHSQFVILGFGAGGAAPIERHALRVATGHGVILALGPQNAADLGRGRRNQLVVSLTDGGGWKSGTDLNGDGHPDVVVRGDDATIEIWCLFPKGASPYPVRSVAPPDHVVDIDGDGRPDLAAHVRVPGGEGLGVAIVDVATFEASGYRNDTAAVKQWHLGEARKLVGQEPGDAGADGGVRRRDDRGALSEAIELAWHLIRAGEPAGKALEAADAAAAARAPLGPGLAQGWVRWRGWLADASR